MQEKASNAQRFIDAYNQIDYGLRARYNMRRSMSFSELIRKSVTINHVVRKYEDELVDYGRLRNAIIHQSKKDVVIAEPHIEAVEEMEKIERLITTPPSALSICGDSVLSVEADVVIEDVIKLMSKHSFSNLPVYSKGTLIGIANGQKILENIGSCLLKNQSVTSYVKETQIKEILKLDSPYKIYEVMPSTASIEQVLDLYHKNRKLLAVLITKSGTMTEAPIGILTSTDVVEMNDILENY